MQNFFGGLAAFLRAAQHNQRGPALGGSLGFLGKAARAAAVLGDKVTDVELLHQCKVQFQRKGPLHGNDVAVRDARALARRNARHGGQHPRVQAGGIQPGKGRKLFGAGGEQTLPCVAAKYCAAWAALPSTTLPAGKVLAARSRRWYSTPAALAAARMFLVASTA